MDYIYVMTSWKRSIVREKLSWLKLTSQKDLVKSHKHIKYKLMQMISLDTHEITHLKNQKKTNVMLPVVI